MRWVSDSETPGRLVVETSARRQADVIDTHCHLDLLLRSDRRAGCRTLSEYQERIGGFNVKGCVTNFEDPRRWLMSSMVKEILSEPGVWGAFGCHPHRAGSFSKEDLQFLKEISREEKVKAIGEIGLDYSRNNRVTSGVQKEVFSRQLELAVEIGMPIVLHIREAERDAHEIVRRIVPRGHMLHRHCVTGDPQVQQMYNEEYANCYFGFTGLVTNPHASNAHEAVRKLPLSRLVLEMDAPYFVPHELRGGWRWSHPGMVVRIAEAIAKIKNLDKEEVAHQTTYNAQRLYDLPLK